MVRHCWVTHVLREIDMRKFVLFAIICTLLAGCATTVAVKDYTRISKKIPFAIGDIENQCGVNPEGKTSTNIMKNALKKALLKSKLRRGNEGYTIDVIITEYKPGNAFKRWLIPGCGETQLTVNCIIKSENGNKAVEIDVSRSVAAGGAYTVGAWEIVFHEVAQALVEEIEQRVG